MQLYGMWNTCIPSAVAAGLRWGGPPGAGIGVAYYYAMVLFCSLLVIFFVFIVAFVIYVDVERKRATGHIERKRNESRHS